MSTGAWALVAVALVVASANILNIGPLLTCPRLGRGEKAGYTLLLWVVPGSFVFVRRAVRAAWGAEGGDLPNPLGDNQDTSDLARRARLRDLYDNDARDPYGYDDRMIFYDDDKR